MSTGEIVIFILLSILSLCAFFISYFQFKEKGFLFNNAYLYASKNERETMNKKPYYRQSAIVFLVLGITFFTDALQVITTFEWLFKVNILCMVIVLVYAIVSSIFIKK